MQSRNVYNKLALLLTIIFLYNMYKNCVFVSNTMLNGKNCSLSNNSSSDYKNILQININEELKENGNSKNYKEDYEIKLKHTSTDLNKNDNRYHNFKAYPRSVVLWTSWRSGSTFLGELLHGAHPNTYYNYEPMMPLGVKIFRDDNKETREARSYLNSTIRCDMKTHQKISLKLSKHGAHQKYNSYLREKCKDPGINCKNSSVLSGLCKNATIHIVKLLRLGLVWAHSLLSDPTLDTKIVYLVRDPRATIRSRRAVPWCFKKRLDCSEPARVCNHILQDLRDAKELRAAYPNKFQFLRYEDLSLNVMGTVKSLWKFLNFSLTNEDQEKINELTTDNGSKDQYRVSRDSVNHTFSWRSKMSYKEMQGIQDHCTEILNILGLRIFHNKEDYMNESLGMFTKTAEDVAAWMN